MLSSAAVIGAALVTCGGQSASFSAAVRFTRGARRWSFAIGIRNVGPDTATAPMTRPPRVIGAASARPPSTSS